MLFWIIVTLIVAATTYAIWQGYDWFDGVPVFFLSIIGGAVVLFICAILIPSHVDLARENTTSLKALGTSSTQQGRFFLGSGYIDGKRVLNYIQQDTSGAIQVKHTDAEDALIFEGSDKATVTKKTYDFNNGWILPWTIASKDKYEFHIPEGSVTESYTIANE